MTAKQYLSQISRLEKMINNKALERYKLESLACSVTVSPESDRVQTSGSKDLIGNAVARITDLESEIQNQLEVYIKLHRKIVSQIEALPVKNHYEVLYLRYVDGRTFNAIADEMGYSWRQVVRIHGDALNEFARRNQNDMSLNVIIGR